MASFCPEDWMSTHPKVCQIRSYGFQDSSQTHCAILVYFDLTEVKLWHAVHIHGNSELQMVVFSGQKTEKDPHSWILPLPASTELSMQRILSYFKSEVKCSDMPEQRLSQQEPTSNRREHMTLALVDTDSTVVYYKLCNGIHPVTD